MRNIGLILLGVAIVLGLAAVWGVRAMSDAQARKAQMEQTTVVVAIRPLDIGAALTPEVLKEQVWPAGSVPEGSFRKISELTGDKPRVALRSVSANEPILTSRISGPGGRATLSALIQPGKRAVTIRVNDVFGVAGFVLPGDFVDILITRSDADRGGDQAMRTDVLLEAVRVLGIDQTASETEDDAKVAKAATIEVTTEQAQKIALAAQVGTLSMALRGNTDALVAAGDVAPLPDTVRVDDLKATREVAAAAAGAAAVAAAPVAQPVRTTVRRPVRRTTRAAPTRTSSMEVVRAGSAEQVSVIRE